MGHYDENRKFDDEWRAAGGKRDEVPQSVKQMSEWWTSMTSDPKESKIKKVRFEVDVPTIVYTNNTFRGWADGQRWVCDTRNAYNPPNREVGIGVVHTSMEGVRSFISDFPHQAGSFYVIADHIDVVKLIIDYPARHIIHMLVE